MQDRNRARVAGLMAVGLIAVVCALWVRRQHSGAAATDPYATMGTPHTPRQSAADRGPRGRLQNGAPSGGPDASSKVRYDAADPAGSLRLEGRVITPQGAPVAGISVTLSSQPPRAAVTEDDGSFFFEGLVPQLYRVYARGAAGIAGPGSVQLSATSEPVTLVIQPGSHLRFIVTAKPTGAPIADARIQVAAIEPGRQAEGALRLEARTDSAGIAEFRSAPVGFVQFRASASGYRTIDLEGLTAPPSLVYERRVELSPAAPLYGVVYAVNGAAAANACIAAFVDRPCEAYTDQRGAFELDAPTALSFEALPSITARHPDLGTGALQPTTASGAPQGNGSAERPYIISLRPDHMVEGRVVDHHGAPVEGAVVRAGTKLALALPEPVVTARQGDEASKHAFTTALDDVFLPTGAPALSDAAGIFQLRLPNDQTPLGVVAYTERQTSQLALLEDATRGPIELVLDDAQQGTLRGRVRTAHGDPAEGALVSAKLLATGTPRRTLAVRGPLVATTNADGVFVIEGAPRGRYRLTAAEPHLARLRSAQASADAETSAAPPPTSSNQPANPPPVVLTLPAIGELLVTVMDDGGAPIANIGAESPMPAQATNRDVPAVLSWTNNPDGKLLIQGLPVGTHRLVIKSKGYADRSIDATIRASETSTARVVLQRLPSPP